MGFTKLTSDNSKVGGILMVNISIGKSNLLKNVFHGTLDVVSALR